MNSLQTAVFSLVVAGLFASTNVSAAGATGSHHLARCFEVRGILANKLNGCTGPMVFTPEGREVIAYRVVDMRADFDSLLRKHYGSFVCGNFILCNASPAEADYCGYPIDYIRIKQAKNVKVRRSDDFDPYPKKDEKEWRERERWIKNCDPAFVGKFE